MGLKQRNISVILSYAGVTSNIKPPINNFRIGGFGGPEGMVKFIKDESITHLLDASHPFSKTITINSIVAAQLSKISYIGFERQKWEKEEEDKWKIVTDINKAVRLLNDTDRIFVTTGNKEIRFLNRKPQPFYLIRMITEPNTKIRLENFKIIYERGPFSFENEVEIMRKYSINKLITKNSGSEAVFAKIQAARKLGLEVIMIDRPALPERKKFKDIEEVYQFFSHVA